MDLISFMIKIVEIYNNHKILNQFFSLAQSTAKLSPNEVKDTCSTGIDCDNSEGKKIKWHDFDWKSYIKKDLRPVHR